jgi:hypothetical protein
MSKQMKYSCPNCDSEKIAVEKRPGGWFHCQDCHYSWQPYPVKFGFDALPCKQTVFDHITASPEVLAPHFVFLKAVIVTNINPQQQWISTLKGEVYPTREKALAATLEELNKVSK